MKRYTPFIYIIISMLCFQILVSCKKDYLDVPPTTVVVEYKYVNDLKACESVLNGVYVMLSDYIYHGLNTIYPELAADNVKPFDNSTFVEHYAWSQLSTEDGYMRPDGGKNMNSLWAGGYGAIRQCSYLLENVDRFRDQDPTKADNIKGQAYAIRALVHHQLVNTFAQPYKFTTSASHQGVPYITISDYTQPVTRQTVAENYKNIITDLNNAISLLPLSSASKLYISLNATKAILARVYLFKNDYAAAKKLAVEISSQVPIMTGDNYPSKLFTPEETEALFQLPPEQNIFLTMFSSYFFRLSQSFVATSDIVELLHERPNDARKNWVTQTGTDWYITKFPTGVVPDQPMPEVSYYLTVIRTSEMYLTAAESYAALGNFDSARYYLNAIRQRADITAPNSTETGAALLDSIYKERRKELSFEGFRMYDLLRTGKGVNRIDAWLPGAIDLPYPSNKAIAPIPIYDVTLAGLAQNPGY